MGSNSGMQLGDTVRCGVGIVRLLDFLCQPLVDSGDLAPILENLGFSSLKIFLMSPEGRRSG